MNSFRNNNGKPILLKMVKSIQDHKGYLAEVDGLIGDGDHGMNMNKGFMAFQTRFIDQEFSFTDGLGELGFIVMNEIGGSMGPIYGTVFMEMAEAGAGLYNITVTDFARMPEAGLNGLFGIVEAKVEDKTLVDTLTPAVDVMKAAAAEGKTFEEAV